MERKNKYRASAISMAWYIIQTHYSHYFKQITTVEIEKELYIQG